MKIFSQQEVVEKIKEFNEYMTKEKELQDEILSLNISGSRDKTSANLKRHDEILKEIEQLRTTKMLPILDELSRFVAYCYKVETGEIKMGDPWPPEEEKTEQKTEEEAKKKK